LQRQVLKSDFVPWVRLSETVLGDDLMQILSDEQIEDLVSNKDWIGLLLPEEDGKDEMKSRADPHIDLKLTDSTIRIGMRCNTVKSVEKLANILEGYHSKDREELINVIRKLDDDFTTEVYAKIKDHNFSESGRYETKFKALTNSIDQSSIDRMFNEAKRIREEGTQRMKDELLPHNPVTPVIDVAYVTIPKDETQFTSKMSQLKPVFEISLRVKTTSELRAEEKKRAELRKTFIPRVRGYSCVKCGKEYSEADARRLRFCPADGMRIRFTAV